MSQPHAGPGWGPPAYAPSAYPSRRRARWPWVLLVVIVLLAGLFVAADRIALSVAESKAADGLQSSQNLPNKPDVSVTGFPFLTQLLSRDFGEIDVDATGIAVDDGKLRIRDVTAHLHDVTVNSDYSSFHVDHADATAHIGYADLSSALGVPVHYGGNGRLVAKPSVTVLGQTFSATVSAAVHASTAQGMTFDDPKVSAAGVSLPDVAAKAIAAVFEQAVSLHGLPFGVEVQSTDVTESGVVLNLAARDLTYSRG